MSLNLSVRSNFMRFNEKLHEIPKPSCGSGPSSSSKRSRTLYACEPCKRRKTKCSGRPGPCVGCRKAGYTCKFSNKHEPGILKRTSLTTEGGQLYILTGLLQAIKHGSDESLTHLIHTLRQNRSHDEVVDSIRSNLQTLQDRGIISRTTLSDADLGFLAEESISNRLTWGQHLSQLGLYTTPETLRDQNVQRHFHSTSFDSSYKLPDYGRPNKLPRLSDPESSSPVNRFNRTIPESPMSSSTISVDVQRSTKLSDCENFQQSDRSGFSDTLQHTFHSPVESVGDAEYYQPAIPTSVHYYQPQQQQHIQASVYAARKSTDLTMLTASNPWLSVASTAHGTYLTQSCYYYAQSLPLNRHSQTFHAYQQAY